MLAYQYWVWNLIAIAAVALFLFATLRAGQEWDGDFALYIMNARNIAEGLPYSQTPFIPNPDNAINPASYPAGLPLILAPVYAMFGVDLAKMKAVCLATFVLSLGFFAAVLRERLPLRFALATIVAIGLHPYIWDFKDSIQSEFAFMLFCYAALLWVHRMQDEQIKTSPAMIAGAGIAIAAAWQTRSAGILLFPAAVLTVLCHHGRNLFHPTVRNTVVALVIAAVVGASLQWVFPADVSTYAHYFDGYSVHELLGKIRRYLQLDRSLFGGEFMWRVRTVRALDLTMVVLFGIGFIAQLRRRITVFEVFFVGYVLLLLIYPIALEPARYTLPIWPLFFLYIASGVYTVATWIASHLGAAPARAFGVAICLGLAANYLFQYRRAHFEPIALSVENAQSHELFEAIRTQLPPDATLLVRKPTIVALFTGRRATIWPVKFSDEELWAYIERTNIGYIVQNMEALDPKVSDDPLDEFVARNGSALRKLFANEWFTLYRIVPRPGPRAAKLVH